MKKPIIDVCCGSRMFWFDKDNPNVEFCDIRQETAHLPDGQTVIVEPNTIADFRHLPFPDNSYKLVVFDPPHLRWAGHASILAAKYGTLEADWGKEIHDGFVECMRVLDDYGTLIFKWNEYQIKLKTILKYIPMAPLFGHKTASKTVWLAFMKLPKTDNL